MSNRTDSKTCLNFFYASKVANCITSFTINMSLSVLHQYISPNKHCRMSSRKINKISPGMFTNFLPSYSIHMSWKWLTLRREAGAAASDSSSGTSSLMVTPSSGPRSIRARSISSPLGWKFTFSIHTTVFALSSHTLLLQTHFCNPEQCFKTTTFTRWAEEHVDIIIRRWSNFTAS